MMPFPTVPSMPSHHIPVLLDEVVSALNPRAGKVYVDGTFGEGGYSRALLKAAPCRVFGIDRDPRAISFGQALKKEFPEQFTLIEGPFSRMQHLLADKDIHHVDGIVLDLGVSSPQIDTPERGFSFRHDGPLDMRMSQHGPTAADAVNNLPEKTLADILWTFGEERFARRIAKHVVEQRTLRPFTTTLQLAEAVRQVVPRSKDGIDPATRTFQALRIYVNDELKELQEGLDSAAKILSSGGRLVVVSFHSLEDRIVKDFMRSHSGREALPSRHMPLPVTFSEEALFSLITRRPIEPSMVELHKNPRSRSARLRAAERTTVPYHVEE